MHSSDLTPACVSLCRRKGGGGGISIQFRRRGSRHTFQVPVSASGLVGGGGGRALLGDNKCRLHTYLIVIFAISLLH